MSGLVFLGEYSTACICELPPKPAETGDKVKPAEPEETSPSAGLGALGAAVAYMSQTVVDEDEPPPPVFRF